MRKIQENEERLGNILIFGGERLATDLPCIVSYKRT